MKFRWLVAVLFLLLLGFSATAIAGGSDSHGGRHAPPMPKPRNTERLRQQAAARLARRKTPAARHARHLSRTRYRRATGPEALGIARKHFKDVIDGRVYKGLRLQAGERVGKYLNDHVAVVDLPGSEKDAIARSTTPLTTETRDGEQTPVDLGLELHGNRLQSRTALAPVSFSQNASGGFTIQDAGLTVSPVTASGADGAVVQDKLFFANVATDTDLLEMPVPAGVETYDVLRSSASPEDLPFALDLPAGAELRLVPGDSGLPAGAQVVRDGRVLVDIPAARAADADGINVPVTYQVHGNELVLHVEHRNKDLRYPLLVDPTYIQQGTNWGTGWSGWNWVRASNAYNFRIGSANYSMYGLKSGMIVEAGPGTTNVNTYGNWYWTSPADTYIYRADWEYVTYQWLYQVVNEGIVSRFGTWETGSSGANPNQLATNYNNNVFTFCFSPPCTQTPSGDHDGNSMIFGMQSIYTNPTYTSPLPATMQGATTFSRDAHSPVIDQATDAGAGTWFDAAAGTVTFTPRDIGFGLTRYTLTGTYGSKVTNVSCTGKLNSPCPLAPGPQQLFYPTNLMPEGTSNLDLYVTDIVNNDSLHRYFPVKVDRTAPNVTLSGSAYDGVGFEDGAEGQLRVDATDGASDGNPANARSGVKSIEILVDDVQQDYVENPSPCDNCALIDEWGYSSADYSAGTHTIKVVVKDQMGHPKTSSWAVKSVPTTSGNTSEKIDPLDDFAVEDLGDPMNDFCLSDPESLSGDYCGEGDATNAADIEVDSELPLDPTAPDDDFGLSPQPGAPAPDFSSASAAPLTSAPAAPALAPYAYGLANPRTDAFDDPRLAKLDLHKVRVIVPWDVVPRATSDRRYTLPNGSTAIARRDPKKLDAIDAYMDKAFLNNYEVLVTFERTVATKQRTGTPKPETYLPTVAEYRDATEAFRSRYRARGETIKLFTAWNEPNHPAQPTSGKPFPNLQPPAFGAKRAGQYWRNLKKRCLSECTVIAGDFSDRKDLSKTYFSSYASGLGYKPHAWAYHAYYAAYNGTGTKPWVERFDKFLKATSSGAAGSKNSRIWLTEQGVRYDLPRVNYCEDVGDQHMKRLLALPRRGKRITRFYYYAWFGGARHDQENPPKKNEFDSGLVDVNTPDANDGNRARARKAFFTYKSKTNPTDTSTFPYFVSC